MAGGPQGAATNALYSMFFEDFKKHIPYIDGNPTNSDPAAAVAGLVQGKYNMAQSLSDIAGAALMGEGFFESTGKLSGFKNLVTLWPMTTVFVVRADSPYEKLEDLKGKSVSPGPRGGSNHLELIRVIQEMGMKEEDFKIQPLGFDDAQQQFLDGHLEALLYTYTNYPNPSLLNVFATENVRFIPLPEDIREKMASKYIGIEKTVLPEGVYTLKDGSKNPEIPGIGGNVHVIVPDNFPEDVAYDMAKVLCENFERYKQSMNALASMTVKDFAKEVPGIEFHPGALKYYKEQGYIQ
ncbi:MAG: TAXI family TRAP transporter solute-binding subunit, partial [Clostridia bacterium]|nr:TAXI family TRAP transporter solute-binding subunit [Clostridia bacterium]